MKLTTLALINCFVRENLNSVVLQSCPVLKMYRLGANLHKIRPSMESDTYLIEHSTNAEGRYKWLTLWNNRVFHKLSTTQECQYCKFCFSCSGGPGFPRGGGANIWFCQIFPKTASNRKNLDAQGGACPSHPHMRQWAVPLQRNWTNEVYNLEMYSYYIPWYVISHLLTPYSGGFRGAWGARDPPPPPGTQILSISCSFRENLAKSYVGPPGKLARPPWGNPGSAPAICCK